jgi:menaquinone-dependent protoporphyrinogen oxidase
MKIMILYAREHGSTAEIARYMHKTLADQKLTVDITSVEAVQSLDDYEVVIAGTAIQNGMWLPRMSRFIHEFKSALETKAFYFWITCIRVLEADSDAHVREHYLRADLLEKLGTRLYTAFAGRLELDQIVFSERWMLSVQYDGYRMIEELKGDYRDWDAIERWIVQVAQNINAIKEFSE